jgi:peptide-methionine (S)-S-oxide reductase
MKRLLLLPCFFLFLTSCASEVKSTNAEPTEVQRDKDLSGFQKAYFASGCFWCVEAIFESVKGVEEAVSGYAGGHTDDPTYESIGTGRTGHAESVEVYYDPEIVSYETLVKVFFSSHDPTTVNGQAPDYGTQYRSMILYQNESEKVIIEQMKTTLSASGNYNAPLATEIVPLEKFYPAEDYHQDYERKHPENPYVRSVSIPRLNKFKEALPNLLKENQPTEH